MNKRTKNSIIIFVVTSLILIAIATIVEIVTSNSNYKTYMKDLEVDAIISEDGSMERIDRVTNHYGGSYHAFFWDIKYGMGKDSSGNEQNNPVFDTESVSVKVYNKKGEELSISNDINDDADVYVGYSFNNDYDEYHSLIRCPDSYKCESIFVYAKNGFDSEMTFQYQYTLKNVVTKYNDIAQFNWNFLDYVDNYAKNIEVSVSLPGMDENLKVYGHGNVGGKYKIVSNNKVVFTLKNFTSGEKFETRILFDKDLVSQMDTTVNKAVFDSIVKKEKSFNSYTQRAFRTILIMALILVLYVLSLLATMIYIYFKHDKELKPNFDGDYYRDLPTKRSPAIVSYLMFEETSGEDFSATLLDLIRRKYIKFEFAGQDIEEESNYKYSLDKDFYNQNKDKLLDYEDYFIKFLFDNKESITTKEIEERANSEASAQTFSSKTRVWMNKVKNEADKCHFFTIKNCYYIAAIYGTLGILLMAVIGIITNAYNIFSFFPFAFIIISILGAILYFGRTITRKTKESMEEYAKWNAFKNFICEFSNMEDYSIPALEVWEHYMVYATSLRVADKVNEQLKIKLNSIESIEGSIPGFYLPYYHSPFRCSMMISNSFKNTIAGANLKVATARMGRSGGFGGFSGGSSFGGGGGGGRSR